MRTLSDIIAESKAAQRQAQQGRVLQGQVIQGAEVKPRRPLKEWLPLIGLILFASPAVIYFEPGFFRVFIFLIAFPFTHPHGFFHIMGYVWKCLACISAVGILFLGLAYLQHIFEPEKAASAPPNANPYGGQYAIDDFTEHSPFGEANLARRAEIQRALAGSQGFGSQPKFEE